MKQPLLTFLLLSLTLPILAQAPTGTISGSVQDESGAQVPGAEITITSKATGASRTLKSGADGIFSAPSLNAGVYTVKASQAGFRTTVRDATVETGAITTVEMRMQVGPSSESVTVEAATSQMEYERDTIDGVVTRQQIANLPLNGRNFLQLAELQPGVKVSPAGLGEFNKQFDVNVLGAGPESVLITVDGATINDTVTSGTQQNFSQEIVQEFQVSEANFDLSTGRTGGGAINVITRGGSNDFHGAGYFYFRDHNLAAYPYLQRDPLHPDPFFARRQGGFWLGGPAIKNRLFFFANYEHTNQVGSYSAAPSSPQFAAFAANADSPYTSNLVGVRLDYRPSDKHSMFLRYSHDGNNGFAPSSSTTLTQPSNWATNWNYADSGVFSIISSLKPTVVNEFRYSLVYWDNQKNPPNALVCPQPCTGLGLPQIAVVGINGLQIGDDAINTPQSRVVRRHILADNITWQKGSHRLRWGGEWEYEKGTGTYAYAEPGGMLLYSPQIVQLFNSQVPAPFQIKIPSAFNTLQDLLQLPVAAFETGVGDINQPPSYNRGAADHYNLSHVYAQDTWKVFPRFTLNYGLAYTYDSNDKNYDLTRPAYLEPILGPNGLGAPQHDNLDFSPALGFAWQPTRDSKTVIRGGAGIYYDPMELTIRLIERAALGPAGTGRVILDDSFFFSSIAQLLNFSALPPPLQPTSLRSGPTPFTGAQLVAFLPQFRAAAAQELGENPNNTNLAVRNVQVFKTSPSQDIMVGDFRLPYVEHASVGLQREIFPGLVLSADFVYKLALHQRIRNTDLNHFNGPSGPVIPKCVGTQAANPAAECSTGPIDFDVSGATSVYKGLLVRVDKRFARRFQLSASYAYQSSFGYNELPGGGSLNSAVVDYDNWRAGYGPQLPHQNLTISGFVDLPWRLQLSMISTFQSKSPFEPFIPKINVDNGQNIQPLPGAGFNEFGVNKSKADLTTYVNQYNSTYGGKGGAPVIALPANYSLGQSFNSQDFRLTKIVRFADEHVELRVFGEVFNAFNIANYDIGSYGNNLAVGGFGQPIARAGQIFGSGGPRAFQLAARLQF